MYSTHLISSMLDIPPLVADFAYALGLDVDESNPDQPIISFLDPTQPAAFRVRATASGSYHYLYAEPENTPDFAASCWTASPFIDSVTLAPTNLHLIGGMAPVPWFAIVIQFGANNFRHMYIGNMEKLGNYTGGEVISSCSGPTVVNPGDVTYLSNRYLFAARNGEGTDTTRGGVLLSHADSSTDFRAFDGPDTIQALSGFTQGQVIGGFGDGVNDGYLARGRSPFSGVNPLIPINLYAPIPLVGDTSFRPIGHPAGVRMVHMQDLAVGARVEIAGEYWRCYPAISRDLETVYPSGGKQTSYMIGYAYFEGA